MGQLNLTGIILGCVRARTPSEVEHIAQFISETISKIPYSLLAFSPRFDTRKNGETYLMEVKHHYNYHTLTGLDESRILRAVFEDVTEGFKLGLNRLKVDKSMIVVNTKFSEHARRYARCRQIHLVG